MSISSQSHTAQQSASAPLVASAAEAVVWAEACASKHVMITSPVRLVHMLHAFVASPCCNLQGAKIMTQPHQSIGQTQKVEFTLSVTNTCRTHCQ